MQIFKEIGALKAFLQSFHTSQKPVGLVPTMGALHQGHLSLISTSKQQNHLTVCSIFVNPTQFNNPADLEKYPRTPERDNKFLRDAGCDVLFTPDVKEMYAQPSALTFDFGQLDKILEGEFRPGHFSGVAVVVSKLLNIVQPANAYFGQKDYQQFRVVSSLVRELKFNVHLHCMPTVREEDGLAMSSRNLRLDAQQRQAAIAFYKALKEAQQGLLSGQEWAAVKARVSAEVNRNPNVRLEYLELADRETLRKLDTVTSAENCVLLIAGYVGEIRLIDNVLLDQS